EVEIHGEGMAVQGGDGRQSVGDLLDAQHRVVVVLGNEDDPGTRIGEAPHQMTVLGGKILMDEKRDHSPSLASSASRSAGSGQSVFRTTAASSKLARRNRA